jgi:predicted ester cyclase
MSTEENMALVRHWFAELDKRNLDIIDQMLPSDYVDHNPPLPGLPPGREGVWQASRMLLAAFPDAVHTIEDQYTEGNRVLTRLTVRATFLGEILGFQPTRNRVEVTGTAVHRIADGQLVEHWAHMDMNDFIRQIGEPAEPEQPG